MCSNDFPVTWPRFEDGRALGIGDKVKLPDGSLLAVKSIIVSEDGFHVSPVGVDKRAVAVGEVVSSPRDDDAESIAEDAKLPVREYIKRRALEVEGQKGDELVHAMIADIMARQAALLA